jgi:Ran GTPase-activating protein (RanGAP) involved in mRNA processing and transport
MSGSGSVTLTSPTPSDCITLIRQISIDRRPCEEIRLNSSSTDSTIILLSLLHQTNVKRLSIYDTKVTVEILQCLCHLININQLKYLRLNNTSLSTNGGLHLLTDAISTNTSLGELWLWNDRLTEDDMVNISQALTTNTTLRRLDLVNCNITDDGLVQLSNGLTHNRTLKELDISDNNLITSTTAVCDIIHNSSLTHLHLYNTSLPSDSIPQLLDALSTNNTIQRLVIDERHREKCEQHENYQHIQDRLDFFR